MNDWDVDVLRLSKANVSPKFIIVLGNCIISRSRVSSRVATDASDWPQPSVEGLAARGNSLYLWPKKFSSYFDPLAYAL